ncbi:hypothetical protein DH2020_011692 [Rehmannia glutinosa]|uniref:Polyphenol oxidase C-terminal domain-containing protein n=1 Tax=Rehmannia glutinosa TaxID=99300 RepID=A0ABR0XE42_REHGL
MAAVSQFSSRPNNVLANPPTIHSSAHKTRTRKFEVRCNFQNDETAPGNKLDRRNLLVGMGGIYGAANLVSANSPALATPVSAPDLTKCTRGTNLNTQQPLDVNCCPRCLRKSLITNCPLSKRCVFAPRRIWPEKEYIGKYEKAVELMKALPDDDPRTDLRYDGKDAADQSRIIQNNLVEMYGEMVRNVSQLEDFYGVKYDADTNSSAGAGAVERGSHTALHSHHANVDRLWSLFRGLRGSKPKDFPDSDWLDSNFLFYDENAQLVRVRVADTLENEKMGYTFQKVDLPWLRFRPIARVRKSKAAATSNAPKATETNFPVKLDKVVKVLVDRPKKSRSKKDKENEEELLVIEGIEVDSAKFVRFEVYVNDEDDKPSELIDKAEYAGCYSQVPHKNSTKVKSKIRLGLTELLEDLDVEDDDQILVSLVPKAGGEDITIGGIKIIYSA